MIPNNSSLEEITFQELGKVNYGGLSALESVLQDQMTINIFMKAIKDNMHQFEGKTVLHISSECNCFYSIFAAQAGAKKVYCVLNGNSYSDKKNAFMMRELIKENGFSEQIEVLFFKDFKIENKVDVLIGEPMGCNLFFDGLLSLIINARDNFLNKETGVMFPNILRYSCAFILDEYQKDEKVAFWNEVYGVKMSGMKQWVGQEPIIRVVDPTLVVSEMVTLFEFNLYETTEKQIDEMKKTINIKTLRKENIKANGLSIWFEADFTLGDGDVLTIDASPWNEETRWSHATLYTNGEWNFMEGEEKSIIFSSKKNESNGEIIIKLKIDNKEEVYRIA